MQQLMEHEAAQIHEYVKIRIDAVNNVGTHWEAEGIPKNPKMRLDWKWVWDEIQILQSERRHEGEKAPTLQDIEDYLRYSLDDSEDNPPPFRKDTIAKIIRAGEKGLLDNVKSR